MVSAPAAGPCLQAALRVSAAVTAYACVTATGNATVNVGVGAGAGAGAGAGKNVDGAVGVIAKQGDEPDPAEPAAPVCVLVLSAVVVPVH